MQVTSIRRVVCGTLIALGLIGASTTAVTPRAADAQGVDVAGLRAPLTGTLHQATVSPPASSTQLWTATVYNALASSVWEPICEAHVQRLGDPQLKPLFLLQQPPYSAGYVVECRFTR